MCREGGGGFIRTSGRMQHEDRVLLIENVGENTASGSITFGHNRERKRTYNMTQVLYTVTQHDTGPTQ